MKKLMAFGIMAVLLLSTAAVIARDTSSLENFQLSEKELEKVFFIRYAPGFQSGKSGLGLTTTCYTFLSGSKPRWNWIEDYYYSGSGLGASSSWATTTWDAVTSKAIFGSGLSGFYPWGTYDYHNAISYGNYKDPGVIAVTAIWFRGKNIYEYDIMFDTDYFSGNSTVDLDTVVLHEFGHAAGLGDLYNSVCSNEVMYGYYAGVKKALASGDITGVQRLYGV